MILLDLLYGLFRGQILVGIFLIVLLLGIQNDAFAGSETIEVPDVVGLSQEDAEEEIGEADLEVDVSEAFSDTVPAGNVISQIPEAG